MQFLTPRRWKTLIALVVCLVCITILTIQEQTSSFSIVYAIGAFLLGITFLGLYRYVKSFIIDNVIGIIKQANTSTNSMNSFSNSRLKMLAFYIICFMIITIDSFQKGKTVEVAIFSTIALLSVFAVARGLERNINSTFAGNLIIQIMIAFYFLRNAVTFYYANELEYDFIYSVLIVAALAFSIFRTVNSRNTDIT